MDIQVHARTQQIKKLSKRLYTFLTAFRYLLYVCWLAVIFIAIAFDKGTLKLGDIMFNLEQMGLWFKIYTLALYSIALYLAIRITNSFRNLMQHFIVGNIFTKQAVFSVRTALNAGLLFYITMLIQKVSGWVIASVNNIFFYKEFEIDIIIVIFFFGLLYILLWALEIGCDLNEESEMTI